MAVRGTRRLVSALLGVVAGCATAWPQNLRQCPITPAGGDRESTHVVYYDARQERFFYDNGNSAPPKLHNGEHAILEVCRAHFGEKFDFSVAEETIPEAGAEVRGLEETAGLISGALGAPSPKGVAPEGISITPYKDVKSIVAQMQTLDDAINLETELEIESSTLRQGLEALRTDFDRYRKAVCQMSTRVTAASCPTPIPNSPGGLDTLEGDLVKLKKEVDSAASSAPNLDPHPLCKATQNTSISTNGYADRGQFVCFVNETNDIIERLKGFRSQIALPPIGPAKASLVAQADGLSKLVQTYEYNLRRASAASAVALFLLDAERTPLSSKVMLDRLKELRESYKDVGSQADLQRIAEDWKRYRIERERPELEKALHRLQGNRVPRYMATANGLESSLRQFTGEVEGVDNGFAARVRTINDELAQEIKDVMALYGRSDTGPIFVRTLSWTSNMAVTINVKTTDTFKPADLSKLESPGSASTIPGVIPLLVPAPTVVPSSTLSDARALPTPPAVAEAVPGSKQRQDGGSSADPEQTTTGKPSSSLSPGGNAGDTSTTNTSVTTAASTAFEVHKTYRFNVAAGALFSFLRQDNFALRDVPRLTANGTPVLDSNGNPVTDLKLVQTGTDRIRLDFPIFLTTYLGKPLDVFSSATANRFHYGTALGFSASDPTNNAYLGGFVQPHLGVDLIFGLHIGRRNVPDSGFVPGVTILKPGTTTLPVHKEWKPGFFFTVGFDALTFKKLFGAKP